MSLTQIASPPRPENSVLRLHASDNIGVARVSLAAGSTVVVAGRSITVRVGIPAGHKIALAAIAPGATVLRYGNNIGRASIAIAPGDHVHIHNLALEDTGIALDDEVRGMPAPSRAQEVPTFQGYQRPDGRAGTRNYIAIAAASNCAAHAVQLIAAHFAANPLPGAINVSGGIDGVVAFPHSEGCGHSIGPDTEQLRRTISGVLDHPNVAGALLIGLGCEVNHIGNYAASDRLAALTLQAAGGTRAVVAEGIAQVQHLAESAAAQTRTTIAASKLVLGLNCGGSDSFSGISANPALGHCSDLLAALGATSVLAETTEIFGAERLLLRRAHTRAVAEKLLHHVTRYRHYLNQFSGSFDDNPSPGNKAGGLTNILEKSLGAVAKGGTTALMDVVDYAERIAGPGLIFMNTPGYDPISLTGLAAGGVNLIAFTTGRGSAIGFPTVPVLKIATNTAMFSSMQDNMDLNAGRIIDGEASVEQIGQEIFARLLAIASGERTRSELLGHREFVPWRIGPVL